MSSSSGEIGAACTGGFFPCSGTWTGNVFLVAVYGFLLAYGARTMADGSELLLEVLHPGFIGGFIIPLLGSLPDATIIFVSICFGDDRTAREQITIGVGTLTGSTIMLLTVAWVAGLLAGRCDIVDGRSVDRRLTRKWSLLRTGITTEKDVRVNAIIMCITTLSYFVIQIAAFVDMIRDTPDSQREDAEDEYVMAGFVLTCVFFVAYSVYMVFDTTMQERRMKAARRKYIMASLFVETIRQQDEGYDASRASTPQARSPSRSPVIAAAHPHHHHGAAAPVYVPCDRSRTVAASAPVANGQEAGASSPAPAVESPSNSYAVLPGCEGDKSLNLIGGEESKPLLVSSTRLLRSSTGADREIQAAIRSWRNRAKAVVTARRLLEEEQRRREEDGQEEGEGEGEKMSKGRLVAKAVLLLAFGTAIVVFFSEPMVSAIDDLSDNLRIPNFYVSFFVTPFASNASELVASVYFCAKKSSKNVSLAMAAVYGAVTMNSTMNLGVFLIMMWVRDIAYVFSSEVIPMLIVILIVGLVASFKDTFTTLDALLVFTLYPASAGLVAFFQSPLIGWSTKPYDPVSLLGFANSTQL
eukprot:m51a1_g7520 putative sodium calcium exchanger protein (583) ;mRNA; r:15418-17717